MDVVSGRADDIAAQAARLFAARGYGATSIDDIGAAAGVSGPAIYWHFSNKQGLLAAMLIDISERLLDGGLRCVADAPDGDRALANLISQQVAFALDEPDLIVVHSREMHHLEVTDARRVRQLQRQYVDVWVEALATSVDAPNVQLAAGVQATIGLINSTPHLGRMDRETVAPMLHRMAMQALAGIAERSPAQVGRR